MSAPRPYASLGRRGQLGRLRKLASRALRRFGIDDARLSVLRFEHNTTFRVDTDTGPYVLRLSRVGIHDERTVASEMEWLTDLAETTDLGIPVPVAARDGSLVVSESTPGVPERRLAVLLRWQEGRFVDLRLTPQHLESVGNLLGQLQNHAMDWTPPPGFTRPCVTALTAAARRASIARPGEQERRHVHPTPEDEERVLTLVAQLLGDDDRSVADALRLVRRSTEALAGLSQASGLIHGDLHQENYLFRDGRALAIDFDDCGWGVHLYDLAVPLSELEDRSNYEALHDALLAGYAAQRWLPDAYDDHLRGLAILRRLQLIVWILESRDHAAFRDDWLPWACKEIRALTATVEA